MTDQPEKQQPEEPRTPAAVRRGLHLHFDPATGIAGDMTVAALVDAGVPEEIVVNAVGAMKVSGLALAFHRDGPSAPGVRFLVTWPGAPGRHSHRHESHHGQESFLGHAFGHHHSRYHEIQRLLRSSGMPAEARTLAEKMFSRLAEVEAKIHGHSVEEVTFHEVGAFDSIADIVGVAAAIAWLEPSAISSTPPLLGSGTVECAHGTIPVPAPATAGLLAGLPVLQGGMGEMTTPTGALVLASLVSDFCASPLTTVVSRGFGIGTKTFNGRPNALAVVLGENRSNHHAKL